MSMALLRSFWSSKGMRAPSRRGVYTPRLGKL